MDQRLKQAQLVDLDGQSVHSDNVKNVMKGLEDDELSVVDDSEDGSADTQLDDDGEFEIVISDEEPEEVAFSLPLIPGSEDQSELQEPSEIEVDDDENIEVVSDPFNWTVPTFLDWVKTTAYNCPRHTGKDVSGLERAIAYYDMILRQFSKATQQDIKGELDVDKVEAMRDEIYDGLKRLKERLDRVSEKYSDKKKTKKKAEVEGGLIKEAGTTKFDINVSLFMSAIARICINSTINAGHDIEVTFDKLCKQYDLTKREKLELLQLLDDMNYPIRRDFGILLGDDYDPTSSDNVEWIANYQA